MTVGNALNGTPHYDRILRSIGVLLILSMLLSGSLYTGIRDTKTSESRASSQLTITGMGADKSEFRNGSEPYLIGAEREEICDLRTSNAKFFATSQGKQAARIWSKPIHWQDDNGIYRDYDTDIIDMEDTQFPLVCNENSIQAGFSSTHIPGSPLVRIEAGGERMVFTPHHMEIVPGDENKNFFPLVAGAEVSGNVIIYDNIYPEIDEMYHVQPDKLKNEFILNELPSYLRNVSLDNDNSLIIYTKIDTSVGISLLSPPVNEGGEGIFAPELLFGLKDDEQGRILRMPRPFIHDSARSKERDMFGDESKLFTDYHITLSGRGNAKELLIGVQVPVSYLLEKDRVFPIYIDPTTEVIKTSIGTGKDTFTCSFYDPLVGDNRNWNMGGDPYLYISPDSGGYYKVFRSMLFFDLSSIQSKDLRFFSGATLNLYCYEDADGNAGNPLEVSLYRMECDWEEGNNIWGPIQNGFGATWLTYDGTHPWDILGGDYEHITIDSTWINNYGWFQWNCKDTMRDWLTGNYSNNGLLLKGTSSGQQLKSFHSKEFGDNSKHPFIEIEFYVKPTIESMNINPMVAINGSEVYFDASCNDPDSQTMEYRWTSDIEGNISDEMFFGLSNLSVGKHRINLTITGPGNYSVFMEAQPLRIVDFLPNIRNLSAIDTPNDQGGSITLIWDYEFTEDFSHYAIYISPIRNLSMLTPEKTVSDINEKSLSLTGMGGLSLINGNEYYITVIVVDVHGFSNKNSHVAGPIIPTDDLAPASIGGISAIDTPDDQGGSITVSWYPLTLGLNQRGGNFFHHYYIYFEKDHFDSVEGLIPEVDDIKELSTSEFELRNHKNAAIEDGENYYVTVLAVDESGNKILNITPFGPVQARDNLPPSSVRNLDSWDRPGDEGGAVVLEWAANSEPDLHQYNIYMSETEISTVKGLQPVDTVEKTENDLVSYIVEGLANDLYYNFAVTAVDVEGNEFPTIEEAVRTQATDDIAPDAIVSLTAADTPLDNGGSITLTWDPCTAPDFKRYILYGSYLDPISDLAGVTPLLFITAVGKQAAVVEDINGEKIHDNRDYYFGLCVEDLNGNINSTTALAGPVRSVDNLAPRILNLTHSNITVFNRTLDRTSGETSYEAGTSWFNASFELEKHEDEVSIGWYLDGRSIGNNYSLS
ncbi:MAG: DNRLRE domain-containing protein, partial [Candidatus Thermoplasmatota archaeon]|nr:DNRLRE domain-containing protein [Candidatus Thermoplasmatota archaeon]